MKSKYEKYAHVLHQSIGLWFDSDNINKKSDPGFQRYMDPDPYPWINHYTIDTKA